MTETDEMISCFGEMEKLKEKIEGFQKQMEALQKQKKANYEKRLLHETTLEPNLKVLKTWLDDYCHSNKVAIESINKTATEEMKKRIIIRIKQNISSIIREEEKLRNLSDQDKFRMGSKVNKYNNIDFDELELNLVSLESDPYNILSKKGNIVYQLYENGKYVKPTPTNDEITKARIEATYNMFNIINKRLDDIESKLS